LGRFINRDPIEEQGGLNLYSFVRNNAVNYWDYLGLDPEDEGYSWGLTSWKTGRPQPAVPITGAFVMAGIAPQTHLGPITVEGEGLILLSIDRDVPGYTSGAIGAVNVGAGPVGVGVGTEWTINSATLETHSSPIVFVGSDNLGIWQTDEGWGVYGAIEASHLLVFGGGITIAGKGPLSAVIESLKGAPYNASPVSAGHSRNTGAQSAFPTQRSGEVSQSGSTAVQRAINEKAAINANQYKPLSSDQVYTLPEYKVNVPRTPESPPPRQENDQPKEGKGRAPSQPPPTKEEIEKEKKRQEELTNALNSLVWGIYQPPPPITHATRQN
jgi:hypothetical protein